MSAERDAIVKRIIADMPMRITDDGLVIQATDLEAALARALDAPRAETAERRVMAVVEAWLPVDSGLTMAEAARRIRAATGCSDIAAREVLEAASEMEIDPWSTENAKRWAKALEGATR